MARILDLEVLKYQENIILSAMIEYNNPLLVEETFGMMIGDIYRTTACKE